jgi:hypothetical protein
MGRKPTEEEVELGQLLNTERDWMARWYARMSGEIEWLTDEKEVFSEAFELLSCQIKRLQGALLFK